MKIRAAIFLFLIIIFTTACSPTISTSNLTLPPSPTDTQSPLVTAEPGASFPTDTPAFPTETLENEITILTNESPDIVLTAMNLQLDNEKLQLTQSAEEIATLRAQISSLETEVASANKDTSSGSSSNYVIPSNVYTVVTVRKASIYVIHEYNSNNAPVMVPYEPRVYVEPGTEAWAYKSEVKADGGAVFYESYDPDGEAELKVYFYAKDIQIRLPNGKPDPDKYPINYVKVGFTEHTVLFVPIAYDDEGKPEMDSYKPIIPYEVGDYEIVDAQYIIATGGARFYPVYDPDGEPSGYLWSKFIKFPLVWD